MDSKGLKMFSPVCRLPILKVTVWALGTSITNVFAVLAFAFAFLSISFDTTREKINTKILSARYYWDTSASCWNVKLHLFELEHSGRRLETIEQTIHTLLLPHIFWLASTHINSARIIKSEIKSPVAFEVIFCECYAKHPHIFTAHKSNFLGRLMQVAGIMNVLAFKVTEKIGIVRGIAQWQQYVLSPRINLARRNAGCFRCKAMNMQAISGLHILWLPPSEISNHHFNYSNDFIIHILCSHRPS